MDEQAKDKITKARVQLQYSHPFFAYLSLHLKPIEFTKDQIEAMKKIYGQGGTMGVDKFANLYYSPEFVNSLTNEQLKTVIVHELCHVALSHTTRGRNRAEESPDGWNISIDAVTNHILLENGFVFDGILSKGIIPHNNILIYGKPPKQIKVKGISKKSSEEIYDELMKQAKSKNMVKEIALYVPIDTHSKHSQETNQNETQLKENKESEKNWKKRMIEAGEMAKQVKGNYPKGMERYIGELLEEKVNWKQVLAQQIKNEIVSDISWSRRARKSMSLGVYLPSTIKENVEVKVVIDLSGSISQDDLRDFLSEICGMARVFKDRIKITLITHEENPSEPIEINQANENKILNLKLKGGGGTDFSPTVRLLNEICGGNELVIWLTDGYGDSVRNMEMDFKLLWILSRNSTDNYIQGTGQIVKIE